MTLDKIWRLLTAIFILVAAIALIGIAFAFQSTMIGVIALWAALICVLWGLIKGVRVIVDYHNENNSEE